MNCINRDLGLTLTYLTARSNMVLKAFQWGKMKILDFPESFVDLKIGRYREFTVLIKVCVFEVMFTFYLDQHDHSKRSFIKDQISGYRCQDHWSPGYWIVRQCSKPLQVA